MERSACKSGLLPGLAALLISLSLNAQEVSKDYHKEYKADMNTIFNLSNRYGNVVITGTDGNQLVIDVKVYVRHPDKERAEKLLGMINVEFSEGDNEISAKTVIDDGFNFTGWGTNREFKINYTVRMPYVTNLTLANRYGNTDIDELRGLVSLDIKYGNLEAGKLTRGNEKPINRIALAYGKASVMDAGWLDMYLRYATSVKIEKSQALLIDSRYSKLYLTETSSVVGDTKYDNYTIEKLNNIVLASGYTDVNISQLGKKLNFEGSYGSLNIEQVPAGFEALDVNVRYSNVRLGISPSASYRLEGKSSYGDIKFDDTNFNYQRRIVETTSSEVAGLVGKDDKTASLVKVSTAYGSVKLF